MTDAANEIRRTYHTCHARGCSAHVPPRMFMCRTHWYMLPRSMRDAIWRVYVPGQEKRMDPTPEYIEVAKRIVDWLAAQECSVAAIPEPELFPHA